MSEYTTILVHKETREKLASMREYKRESYEEVINKLITVYDKLMAAKGELSDKTKEDISEARKQIRAGRGITTKKLLAELGI